MNDGDWMIIFQCLLDEDLGALAAIDLALLDDNDCTGDTALKAAINHGSLAAVQMLLSNGADPNFLNRSVAYSALYEAVDQKRLDMVSALLEAGADPDLSFPGLSSARALAGDLRLTDCLRLFDTFGPEAIRHSDMNID